MDDEPSLDVEIKYFDDEKGQKSWNNYYNESSNNDFEVFSEFDWGEDDEYYQSSRKDGQRFAALLNPDEEEEKDIRMQQAQRKPKKTKRRRKEVEPDDPRLQCLDNYINAMNSNDPDQFWQHIHSTSTLDTLHIQRYIDEVPDVCMYREMRGAEQIYKFTLANWEAIPDLTLTLISRKLFVRSNERSYLVGTIEATGSWLFQIQTLNYENESKNFLSRWNPFTRLYRFIIKTSGSSSTINSGEGKEKEKKEVVANQSSSSSNPSHTATAAAVKDSSSGKTELFPKAVRGKANPAISTIKVSQDSIKVSTASTAFDTSQKKDKPFKLNISLTLIIFLNEKNLCYRSEMIKRAKASFDVEAYLTGNFDDDGNSLVESMEVAET